MAQTIEVRIGNVANRLREMLDKAERMVVQVDRTSVVDVLTLLDRIEVMFDEFDKAEEGPDLRPEKTRWLSLLNRINSQPQPIVRAANAAGGLPKLRRENPPAENFWWHLDTELAHRRRQAIRRGLTTLLISVVVIAGALWAVNTFFPPDPTAVAMVETTNAIDQFVSTQNWEQALEVVRAARAQMPEQPELMIWEAVLLEQLGDPAAAAEALAHAQAALTDQPIQLYLYLGNYRLQVGNTEGAEQAAMQAQELDPEEPQVYFLLGGIAETRGEITKAINYFDQVFELAQESNPQLAVIARVRMGQLLQSPNALRSPVATPTAP